MKKYICLLALFSTVGTLLALMSNGFTTWNDLVDRSPDIIIARCLATEDLLKPEPKVFYSNVFSSDIQIISVLKGNANPGFSHMTSLYQPFRGEYMLLFASRYQYETDSIYGATEEYRVVPLIHFHGTNELAGKPLGMQIQLLLKNRLNDLNQIMAQNNEEKRRIEAGLYTNSASGFSTNTVPNAAETRSPQQGGTSF
jgi:hypothetical protein